MPGKLFFICAISPVEPGSPHSLCCYAFFISCLIPHLWFDNLLSLFVTRTMLVQELTNELTFFCCVAVAVAVDDSLSHYWKLSYNRLSLYPPFRRFVVFLLFLCKTNKYSL